MAYGSHAGLEGLTSGFKDVVSEYGSKAFGDISAQKFDANSELAGQFLGSKAALKGQEALARAQMYQADKAASIAPFQIAGDIVGAGLAGFTGGLGDAAGKKWFA